MSDKLDDLFAKLNIKTLDEPVRGATSRDKSANGLRRQFLDGIEKQIKAAEKRANEFKATTYATDQNGVIIKIDGKDVKVPANYPQSDKKGKSPEWFRVNRFGIFITTLYLGNQRIGKDIPIVSGSLKDVVKILETVKKSAVDGEFDEILLEIQKKSDGVRAENRAKRLEEERAALAAAQAAAAASPAAAGDQQAA